MRVKRRRKQALVDLADSAKIPVAILIELQRAGVLPQVLAAVTETDRQALTVVRWMLGDKEILRRQATRLSRKNRQKLLASVGDVDLVHWERVAMGSFVGEYERKYDQMDRAEHEGVEVKDVPVEIAYVLSILTQQCNVAGTWWTKARLRELREIARKRVRRQRQRDGKRLW